MVMESTRNVWGLCFYYSKHTKRPPRPQAAGSFTPKACSDGPTDPLQQASKIRSSIVKRRNVVFQFRDGQHHAAMLMTAARESLQMWDTDQDSQIDFTELATGVEQARTHTDSTKSRPSTAVDALSTPPIIRYSQHQKREQKVRRTGKTEVAKRTNALAYQFQHKTHQTHLTP